MSQTPQRGSSGLTEMRMSCLPDDQDVHHLFTLPGMWGYLYAPETTPRYSQKKAEAVPGFRTD